MLTRWDPFREMMNLRRTVDRLLDNTVDSQGDEWTQAVPWGLSLDVIENKDDFVVKASIPGIDPEDIDITYTDDTLTIKGETKADPKSKRKHITCVSAVTVASPAASASPSR